MNSKKGFTLLELLAVIVILAIVSLIATPIVLNIISGAKENSDDMSLNNYLIAVNQAVAKSLLTATSNEYDGIYTISDGGKVLTNNVVSNKILAVEFNGKINTSKAIQIKNSSAKYVTNPDCFNIEDGVLSNNSSQFSSQGDVCKVNMTISDEATAIKSSGFLGKSVSGTLTIPNTVTTIGEYAFMDNAISDELIIPDSVITID